MNKMWTDSIHRIIPYAIKVAGIFYGVFKEHYETKRKYIKWKRKRE